MRIYPSGSNFKNLSAPKPSGILCMDAWLPVIATLSGALVAGIIAVFVQWLANKHERNHTIILLGEERARWATERYLDRLQIFFAAIESLAEAAGGFRLHNAWAIRTSEDGLEPPKWVPSYDEARSKLDDSLHEARMQVFLLDENTISEFNAAIKNYTAWQCARYRDEGVEHLFQLEKDLAEFRNWLSLQYRKSFDRRKSGLDIISD